MMKLYSSYTFLTNVMKWDIEKAYIHFGLPVVRSGKVFFIELTVSSLPDEETIWDCSFLYILFYVLFLLPLKLTDTNTIGPSFHSTTNI